MRLKTLALLAVSAVAAAAAGIWGGSYPNLPERKKEQEKRRSVSWLSPWS